ncbi:MAG: hypothetical protein DMG07_10835, partial [Acidobacteria bacterium]
MNVIRRIEVLWLALALLPGPALGQVKIGRVAGAPGSLAASAGVAFQASGNTGYLSNPGSGLIQKFRTTTGEVLASLQLAPGVGSITLSPDERTLAVVGVSAQKVYLVNTADLTVKKELTVAGSGYTVRSNVVITSDNLTVMIADPPRNGVDAFNLVDGSYDRLIPAGLNPMILTRTLTPQGEERMGVLASGKFSDDEKSVHVIDTRTLAVVETRVLSATTESFNNVQFGGDGRNQYLIVPAYDSNSLQILTLNGSGVLASRASGGKGPSKVLTSPNGRYLAVINATSKSVELLSVPELFVVRDIPLSDSDFTVDTTLAFSPDSRTLFIPSLNTGEVILYDVEGGAIKKRIAVGERPVSVSVSGDGAVAALVNTGSNDLALVAVSPLPLYVPHLVQSATDYSGIALANFGAEQANVALVARDNAGKMLAGTAN